MSRQWKERAAFLVIPSTGTRIPVPDGPDDDPDIIRAEHEALAAHPEVQARIARQQARRAAGVRGIPAELLYRELGLQRPVEAGTEEAAAVTYSGKLNLRLPRTLHQQLAEQAEREGVSLHQLILAYLAKGLGEASGQEVSAPS